MQLPETTPYLQRVGTAVLAPTSGQTTIAKAKDVFPGFIAPEFSLLDTGDSGVDTAEQQIVIYDLENSGTFTQMFGSLEVDPHFLCFSQGQIKEICLTHREWIPKGVYACHFLFKFKGQILMACAHFGEAKLGIHIVDPLFDGVWTAAFRIRIIVPQQAV